MDMMFNTEMIVKDMKGGKEDMTEKRFYLDENGINDKEYEFSILSEEELVDRINELNDENKKLKLENIGLKYALKYIKEIDVKIEVDDFND